uniref:Reverse transcriptase domain-containing protein n=1 Tax=Hucho hucho TaxID=62062 RepID=A0A4W5LQJ5_9TELE
MIKPATAAQFSETFSIVMETIGSSACLDTDELISSFLSTCRIILDKIAPLKSRHSKSNSEPWINDLTRAARQKCRKAERQWKKHKLQVFYDILKDCWRNYQRTVKAEMAKYLSDVINKNCHKPYVLFSTINSVLHTPQSKKQEESSVACEKFLHFFVEKIATIRASISLPAFDPSISTVCAAVFIKFEPVSLSALNDIVTHLKPSICPADIVPPRLFKEVWPTIGPSIQAIINSSLTSGYVPLCFKEAVVQPLIKKPNLDTSILANYRPISKLPFMSKILEKAVLVQLQSFLDLHGILEVFQSGFKAFHSTETALIKVFNDLLISTDSGDSAILMLLDLTAAFDTVDHCVLISRLEHSVGIKGTALEWFRSYLSERVFKVGVGGSTSPAAPLSCGVPQGSILGPILFSLYLLPLGSILKKHNISFHFYADDSQ